MAPLIHFVYSFFSLDGNVSKCHPQKIRFSPGSFFGDVLHLSDGQCIHPLRCIDYAKKFQHHMKELEEHKEQQQSP
jgi:hypothetical protein